MSESNDYVSPTESALQRTTPECTCHWKYMHHPDCALSSPPTAAVLRPPTPEGDAGE